MKRTLVALVAILVALAGCSSEAKHKPRAITTTSAAPFTGDKVSMTDDLDACSVFTEADIAGLTRIAVTTEQPSNSDASAAAGPGRGCLYQTKVDGSIKTYGQVFFLLVKAASADNARKIFENNFDDDTLTQLAGIGDAAGYTGVTNETATEVDGAALRGSLVIVTKCLRTPDSGGKTRTVDAIVTECTVPLLHAILARIA